MNDIGQQFRMMLVTATSPDGNVRATITGELTLRIDFRAGSYEWYNETDLAGQLAGLARNTWVAWERERREINRLASGLTRAEFDEARQSQKDQEPASYAEALHSIECTGHSSGHTVVIRTIGMTTWEIGIADGTLSRRSASQLSSEVVTAFGSLVRDRESKVVRLKADHFDIGHPPQLANARSGFLSG